MSACLCTHSYHDEIYEFIVVGRIVETSFASFAKFLHHIPDIENRVERMELCSQ